MHLRRLVGIPKIRITKVEVKQSTIFIFATSIGKRAKCPACNKYSSSVHDRYARRITDLPVFLYDSVITLTVRKFKCPNKKCHRKVYTEKIEHIKPYARRTERVNRLLSNIAIEMTSGAGSMLSGRLKMHVSRSTLTRLAHLQPLPGLEAIRVLGVDDWAFRKGINYGTILIDMQSSKPIDLLPTRDGEDLKKWLRSHPEIEIVTRDRASSYSSAIDSACPKAMQVADRFHLLMNLSDALNTYFKSVSPKINALIKKKSDEMPETIGFHQTSVKIVEPEPDLKAFDSRQPAFEKVKELQAKGMTKKKIAKAIGLSRNTVRKYFLQETLVPKSHPKRTNIELFTNYIISRIKQEGHLNGAIVEEIRQMGYQGGNTQAYEHINFLKRTIPTNIAASRTELQQQEIPYVKRLSTRKLARYIGSDMNQIKDAEDKKYVQILLKELPQLKQIRQLVRTFKTILKTGTGDIAKWILKVKESSSKLPGLLTFARGLERDIEAVKNGICQKWSNGPVEGHVNRIKSIKRQMYGRASFELLRKKVLLSQYG